MSAVVSSELVAKRIENKIKWARVNFDKLEAQAEGEKEKKKKSTLARLKNVLLCKGLGKVFQRNLIWNGTLKKIERKYGGGFLSLFEFIRWLMLVNLVNGLLILVFVVLPQELYNFDVTNRSLSLNTTFYQEANNFCKSNQTNQTVLQTPVNFTDYQSNIVFTKCCSLAYKKIIDDKISSDDQGVTDFFLDLLQGTGKLEDSFLFYGYYSNRSAAALFADVAEGEEPGAEMPDKHIYYMGLWLAFISIASLLITAVAMLCRMGSGIRKSIVNRLDSVTTSKYCQFAFSSWDYKLQGKEIIKHEQDVNFRFLRTSIKQLSANMHKKKLSGMSRAWRVAKNTLISLLVVAMFPAAGYGFFRLNEYSEDFVNKINEDILDNQYSNYVVTVVQYLPVVSLKAITFILTLIFYQIQALEDYKENTRFTLLLVRLGFARIGSLFFLVITIAINLLRNANECGFQAVDFSKFVSVNLTDVSQPKANILCYETYIGQEFYKLVIVDSLLQVAWLLLNFFRWLCSVGCNKRSLKAEFNLEQTFLDLLYIQTVFWLSIYFSPFIGVFACFYYLVKFLFTLVTLRVLSELPKNKPQIESKINNSFFFVLFINFLLVLLIYGVIFNGLRPSRSCGPFRLQVTEGNYGDFTILGEINNVMRRKLPQGFFNLLELVLSNLFLWPFSFALVLVVWLIFTYGRTYRELADELRKLVEDEKKRNRGIVKEVNRLERKWKFLNK